MSFFATMTPEEMNVVAATLSTCGGYAAVGLAAAGSAVGAGLAGSAAIGAWKRCYLANKPAPATLALFAAAPLSQTIYALILMLLMKAPETGFNSQLIFHPVVGIFAGVAFLMSALFQGRAAAAACDAYGETEKGFSNMITIVGIVETVALFALVFALMMVM